MFSSIDHKTVVITKDGKYRVGDQVKVMYAFGNEATEYTGYIDFILTPDDIIVHIPLDGIGYALITVKEHERERMKLSHIEKSL